MLDTTVFLLGEFLALRGGKNRSLKFKQFTLIKGEKGVPDKLYYNSFGEKIVREALRTESAHRRELNTMLIPVKLPDARFNFIENTFLNGEGYLLSLYFRQYKLYDLKAIYINVNV